LSFRIRALAACAASLLALVSAARPHAEPNAEDQSTLSLDTGGPMPAEQAGPGVRSRRPEVQDDPRRKAIEGEATLTFTAKAPLDKLVLDFDRDLRDPQADHRRQGAEARRPGPIPRAG
jgi:hypothetical protein